MQFGRWEDTKRQRDVEHVPDVSADIELSMNKLFLNELEDGEDHIRMQKIVVPPLSPKMLHAISLHKHVNTIHENIKINDNKTEKVELKIPIFNESSWTNVTNLNFSQTDFKQFKRNQEVEICELSKTIVDQILIKSVATLFAQIGYETSQQSALDVLTDVLQEFLRKICRHMKVAIDDAETQQLNGFPHAIERVLVEMGLGGIKTLNDYYQVRVIKYIDVLENRCRSLTDDYENLLVPRSPSPLDKFNKVVRVKVEEEDVVEVENPEVHFSTIDGDVNFSILETGYQLLNSLEAETNLHTMVDGVEDITSTESPGVVSLSSEDAAHLSPYSKKKRFK